jgi:hypothetical protein
MVATSDDTNWHPFDFAWNVANCNITGLHWADQVACNAVVENSHVCDSMLGGHGLWFWIVPRAISSDVLLPGNRWHHTCWYNRWWQRRPIQDCNRCSCIASCDFRQSPLALGSRKTVSHRPLENKEFMCPVLTQGHSRETG